METRRDSSIGRDIIRDIDMDDKGVRDAAPRPKAPKSTPRRKRVLLRRSGTAMKPAAPPAEPAVKAQEPAAQVQEPAAQVQGPAVEQDKEYEIDSFEGHRVHEKISAVDIRVKWAHGVQSWEPEHALQRQVPELVYKYWDKVGGRDKATGLKLYHVFKVFPQKSEKWIHPRWMTQWVGYRIDGYSHESEEHLNKIAPGELAKAKAEFRAMRGREKKRARVSYKYS